MFKSSCLTAQEDNLQKRRFFGLSRQVETRIPHFTRPKSEKNWPLFCRNVQLDPPCGRWHRITCGGGGRDGERREQEEERRVNETSISIFAYLFQRLNKPFSWKMNQKIHTFSFEASLGSRRYRHGLWQDKTIIFQACNALFNSYHSIEIWLLYLKSTFS